jgi:hypothetical protein
MAATLITFCILMAILGIEAVIHGREEGHDGG